MPETVDKARARRLLAQSLESSDAFDKIGSKINFKTPQVKKSNEEEVVVDDSLPFSTQMLTMRNQLYMDPFDEFDPHHRISGRKVFETSKTRCMQSKIILKFRDEEAKKREKEKVAVTQEFLDKFDAEYLDMCDTKKMNRKQRGVSNDNPFEPHNKPPQ